MYYVADGLAYYKDKTTNCKLKKGYLYFFPTTKSYTVDQDKILGFDCMYVHFMLTPYVVNNLIEINIEQDPFLMYCVKTITELALKTNGETGFDILSSLMEALKLYLGELNSFNKISSNIQLALDRITGDYNKDYSVEDLSLISGYSKEHFIRLFKKQIGITPNQFTIKHKMKLAQKLLLGGKTVTEVSYNLGFNELRSFSRSFKLIYGISPKQFLDNNRNTP